MEKSKTSGSYWLLIIVSYLAFISLGLPDGLLGASWPSISQDAQVSIDSLGILLISFVGGYLSTSTTTGHILTRISLGLLLSLSCAVTGISLLAYAYANFWFMIIIAAFFLGAGGGAIDTSINAFAAARFSPSVVNWLHAFYGIGATLGPFIITWMLISGRGWFNGYILVGIIQISLALVFFLTLKYWKLSSAHEPDQPSASLREALRQPSVWIGILLFFLYTGIEVGIGQWIFSLLTRARGFSEGRAGIWTSIYWGSLTAGRIIFGFVLTRVSVHRVIIGAMSGIIAGTFLLLIHQSPFLTLAGIIVAGFASAPVFPCMISNTPLRVGQKFATSVIGFQISAAMIGGAFLPAFAGLLSGYFGWEVIPLMFFIESMILLAGYLSSAKGRHRMPVKA